MHWPTKLRKLSHTNTEREGERGEIERESSETSYSSQFCLLSISAIFLLLSLSGTQLYSLFGLFFFLPLLQLLLPLLVLLLFGIVSLIVYVNEIHMFDFYAAASADHLPSLICYLPYTLYDLRYTITIYMKLAWWMCLNFVFNSSLILDIIDKVCMFRQISQLIPISHLLYTLYNLRYLRSTHDECGSVFFAILAWL